MADSKPEYPPLRTYYLIEEPLLSWQMAGGERPAWYGMEQTVSRGRV